MQMKRPRAGSALFITVFMVLIGVMFGCSGSENSTSNLPNSDNRVGTPRESSQHEPPAVPTVPQEPKDTTLTGIDVSLNLQEFQRKYANKIKSCVEDSYSDEDLAPGQKLQIKVCTLKSHDASASFYDGRLYHFSSKATGNNIKLWVAAEELEKKANQTPTIGTFGDIMMTYCGATVKFSNGEASVISENITDDLLEQRSLGNYDRKCTEVMFMKKDWESLIYNSPDLKESMKAALTRLLLNSDREKAGNVSL